MSIRGSAMPHTRDGVRVTATTRTVSNATETDSIDADQDRVIVGFQHYHSTQVSDGDTATQIQHWIGGTAPDPADAEWEDDEDYWVISTIQQPATGSAPVETGNRHAWYGQESGIYWPEGVTLSVEMQEVGGNSVNLKAIIYWVIADDLPVFP